MYKILIKYKSAIDKIFWQSYNATDKDGNSVEFATPSLEELKTEIQKISQEIGIENLRIINDLAFDISINMDGEVIIDTPTSDDVIDLYNSAYNKIFTPAGDVT